MKKEYQPIVYYADEIALDKLEHDKLNHRGKIRESFQIALKNLRKAARLHLHDTALSFAKTCLNYFSSVEPNSKSRKRYEKLIEKYSNLRNRQERSEYLFNNFTYSFTRRKMNDLGPLVEEFRALLNGELNYAIASNCYHALSMYYTATREEEKLLNVCTSAIKYFQELPFKASRPIYTFTFNLLPIYIDRKRYEEVEQLISEALPKNRDLAYFKCCQFRAINYLRSGQYRRAQDYIFNLPTNKMPAELRGEWDIYKGYTIVLGMLGMIENKYKFRFSRLFKELDVLDPEHQNGNRNIVLLEILYHFSKNKTTLTKRVDAIKRYQFALAKKGDRYYHLLTILIKWIEFSFSKKALEAGFQKLDNQPAYPCHQELVLYTDLICMLQSDKLKD